MQKSEEQLPNLNGLELMLEKMENQASEDAVKDRIRAVKEVECPDDPTQLLDFLLTHYKHVRIMLIEDSKSEMYLPEWEIWSGIFNRSWRRNVNDDTPKYRRHQYSRIFTIWGFCHKILLQYRKPKLLRKQKVIHKLVKNIKIVKMEFNNARIDEMLEESFPPELKT